MPVGIIPDISEQMCIGCALCVEICTTLGPDVLRVKPVEGWKRGKAFVFYPEVPLHKDSVFVKGWTELVD
jgi:formate hydrogenlyase subunit 6/NADH:ubiquinone oxidoreductase subunit I